MIQEGLCVCYRAEACSSQQNSLSVCPHNVFNGRSTHSASPVRVMLITVRHLATLSCYSSHTDTTHARASSRPRSVHISGANKTAKIHPLGVHKHAYTKFTQQKRKTAIKKHSMLHISAIGMIFLSF